MAAFRYQEAQPDHEARKIVFEDGIEPGLIGKLQGLKYDYEDHWDRGLPLANLADYAPLVAEAVTKWINTKGLPLP